MALRIDNDQKLWEQAQRADPFEMARILLILRERHWNPKNPLEKEWFDELTNLCAPCYTEALVQQMDDPLWQKGCAEVISVIQPCVSAGNYSIHVIDSEAILTHSPASSGLVESWSVPTCQAQFQRKLYSRRSAFNLSRDGKILVGYTDANTIAVDKFPECERLLEWKHPNTSASFRIEALTYSNEIVATDQLGTIFFLCNESGTMRRHEGILPRKQSLLTASSNGRYLIIPRYDLRNASIWSFPEREKCASIDGEGTTEITLLRAAFSPDSRFLIATGVNELQVRKEPFTERLFSIKLGRGNDLPAFAISHDSKLLALLPRSNPAQIQIVSLLSGEIINVLKLPAFFSRYPAIEMKFTIDGKFILLSGQERVYLVKTDGTDFASERELVKEKSGRRTHELKQSDIDELNELILTKWVNLGLRPWIDMMLYLYKRNSLNDIEIAEPIASDEIASAFDIALED